MMQYSADSQVTGHLENSVAINQIIANAGSHVQFGGHSVADRDSMMEWLSPLKFFGTHDDIFNRRQKGTGQWLLESGKFKKWVSLSGRSLLCQGMPGAGKTVLASIVVDHLLHQFKDDPTVGVAFIYCSYKEKDKQTPANLIASLLWQLDDKKKEGSTTKYVERLYANHCKKATRPLLQEVSNILTALVQSYTRVFIVIDALDECPEDGQIRRSLITKLTSLASVNLLVTSREGIQFPSTEQLTINANTEDLQTYINGRICKLLSDELSQQVRGGKHLMQIQNTVAEKAKGMFLLAKLHMDSLETKTNLADLLAAAEALPTGLDATYKNTMERINGQNKHYRELAEGVLTWLSYACRQLTVEELQHALAIQRGTGYLDTDRIAAKILLVTVCAGLVVIDQGSNLIRLVHSTANDYIRETQTQLTPRTIATGCLTYMSFDVFGESHSYSYEELNGWLHEYPLLTYATQYWGDHARGDTEESVAELALKFLEHNQKRMSYIQVARYTKYRYPKKSQNIPQKQDGLYIAVSLGLSRIIEMLVQKGLDIKRKDEVGRTMLHDAARMGNEMAVQLLLRREDTELNSKNEHGQTPLWEAAQGKHEAVVVRLLEDNRIEVNSKDKCGRTPLWEAAEKGREAIVKLLLGRRDVEVNAKATEGRAPLWEAAKGGHDSVVKLLLEHKDIEVNWKDEYDGGTPLWVASKEGRNSVVKLLLGQRGIEVNSKDKFNHRTPLWVAARGGHETVVKLLLGNKDIEVNSKDSYGDTPLSVAMKHKDVARLLQAHGGIEGNLNDKNCQTRLSMTGGGGSMTGEGGLMTGEGGSMTGGGGSEDVVELLQEDGGSKAEGRRTSHRGVFYRGYKATAELLLSRHPTR